ncbi:hypothetical protein ACFL6S_09160 [Candidatus Poribacteria bacterium]
MPRLRSREISVLMDMAGCPNRCRHCWLVCPPNKRVSEETFRWVVQQFREWIYPGKQWAQSEWERGSTHSAL